MLVVTADEPVPSPTGNVPTSAGSVLAAAPDEDIKGKVLPYSVTV